MLEEKLGCELSRTTNAEESVARGCALQCAMLSPVFKVREFGVVERTSMPVHIEWLAADAASDAEPNKTEVFVGSTINVPSSKLVTFPRATDYVVRAKYAEPSKDVPALVGEYRVKAVDPMPVILHFLFVFGNVL